MRATGSSRSSTWSRSWGSAAGWASRRSGTGAGSGARGKAATTRADRSPRRRSAWENSSVTVSQTTPAERSFHERMDAFERTQLSPPAARSYPARRGGARGARPPRPPPARASSPRGGAVAEDDSPLRTPFQRDRDRIVHSKAFRRLKHKTQVFVAPEGDHYRTRLTHTLEVTGISRTVARALRLNEDLTEAIGLGHDVGHPPFGHIGEAALDACVRARYGGALRRRAA